MILSSRIRKLYNPDAPFNADDDPEEDDEDDEGREWDVYYIFGWGLGEVLKASKFRYLRGRPRLHVPERIEFIGSLKEYLYSLPNVEDDWYKDSLQKYSVPKMLVE